MSARTITGVLVGLIFGVLSNYIFEGFGFNRRAAKRSSRRALKRVKRLEAEKAEIRAVVDKPNGALYFIVGRTFLLNLLWIFQESVDYLIGLGSNTAATFYRYVYVFNVDPDIAISGTSAVGSAVGALWLLVLANWGLRTHRKWRRIINFAEYEHQTQLEIDELRLVADSKSGSTI